MCKLFFQWCWEYFFEFSLLELACLLTTEGGEVCDFLPKSRIYTSLISIIKTKNIATVNSLPSDRKKISGLIFHDNNKKEIHFLLRDNIFIISNIR